ncbi:MAG: PDZ domain-containing protein, partial [Actinophytocola sp.]|nr:PDZ domain-containing protein [Actinophytocola sp.]
MSEPDNAEPGSTSSASTARPGDASKPSDHGRMNRRTWTIVLSVLVVAVFIVVGSVVRIPYVALGPGPTHDTLGAAKSGPVIKID